MEDTVSLEGFVETSRKALEAFEHYWKTHHKKSPKDFPLRLSTGDWDEQFNAFCETRHLLE